MADACDRINRFVSLHNLEPVPVIQRAARPINVANEKRQQRASRSPILNPSLSRVAGFPEGLEDRVYVLFFGEGAEEIAFEGDHGFAVVGFAVTIGE